MPAAGPKPDLPQRWRRHRRGPQACRRRLADPPCRGGLHQDVLAAGGARAGATGTVTLDASSRSALYPAAAAAAIGRRRAGIRALAAYQGRRGGGGGNIALAVADLLSRVNLTYPLFEPGRAGSIRNVDIVRPPNHRRCGGRKGIGRAVTCLVVGTRSAFRMHALPGQTDDLVSIPWGIAPGYLRMGVSRL